MPPSDCQTQAAPVRLLVAVPYKICSRSALSSGNRVFQQPVRGTRRLRLFRRPWRHQSLDLHGERHPRQESLRSLFHQYQRAVLRPVISVGRTSQNVQY